MDDGIRSNIINSVVSKANEHRDNWRDGGNLYWTWRLIQEVFEIIGVILGVHNDYIQHELSQISSICINWKEKIEDEAMKEKFNT